MKNLRFAVAVLMPQASTSDIVSAAIRNQVHIIDKENFDPLKDYRFSKRENEVDIFPLFIFGKQTILADTEESYNRAISVIRELSL